jgi:hypothetical protein
MYERYQGERIPTELLYPQERARPPAPGRRSRIIVVLAICVLLASVLVLFFQFRSFLGHLEVRLATESGGHTRIRAMSQQMEALRDRFNGLLAESVEVRLKALEKSVEAGKVSADDLRVFAELQKDINLLESYASGGGALSFDYAQREHSRFRALPETKPAARNDDLMNEVLALKSLFYLCVAGLMTGTAAIMGCYWALHRRNVRYLGATEERMLMLARPTDSGA